MSQWNNSYAYNNQYQGANNWNGDGNGQYMNQGYYTRPEGAQQYVSFNEFLNQVMPGNAVAGSAPNYNNVQYDSYPPQQYRYQNMPSTSQTPAGNYNYQSVPANMASEVNTYQQSAPSQYTPQPEQAYTASNNIILNSNLTATATEFVPKSVSQPSTTSSTQNIPEATNTQNVANEVQSNYLKKPKGSSSDKNWRERPQSSQSSEKKEKPAVNGNSNENRKVYSNNPRNQDTYRKNEGNGRNNENKNQDASNRDNESAGPSQESNHHNNESYSQNESINHENSKKNYNNRNRNYESNSHSYDSNNRNQDSNNRNQENQPRNNDSNSRNSRNYESNRNQDYSKNQDHNQDTNTPYESNNRNDRRNQPKNSKFKGKESDNRTFYNSSMPKEQDTRGGRGEGSGRNRNWGGSQRLKGADRNNVEDEQYASNYTPQREEKYDRDNKEREKYDRDNKERDQYDRDNKERDRYDRDNKERDRYNRDNKERDRYDRDNKERDRYDRDNKERERYNRDRERYDRERDRSERERAPRVQNSASASPRFRGKQGDQVNKEMTQRERLGEQLDKGTLECLVCCDRVKQMDPVWWCTNCYHVLHLRCIRKWAISSMVEGKWRCPACQNCSDSIPTEYRCMCGAVRSPEYSRGAGGAHTCGRACRRARACPHPCTLLCHPGPCPPCQATVTRQCGCGAETRSILCSSKLAQVCGRVCSRSLECEVHTCTKECHEGPCDACAETVEQVCHCPAAQARTVPCTRGAGTAWSCGGACGRVLACGAHVCRAPCHAPPCEPCALRPEAVPACPCGKMKLEPTARKSCTDPIPLCGNICAKPLSCGPAGDKHFCKIDCHEGECPVCPEKTLVQCRCGHSSREVPCADLPDMLNNVLCQKKCNKKLSCGRHRCRATCCAGGAHRCAVPCGRSLACGAHRCEDFCHTGHCAPCPRVSFSELTCECGAQVVHPPVRCGTRPPPCDAECGRARPCSHPPHHNCHSGDCPPCVVLTTKRCYGGHEERKTIPCSQEEFSCGLPCGKPLPCGKHTCIKTCHKGPCDTGKCTQPCMEKRPSCGHPCAAPCHAGSGGECPSSTACKRLVRASCPCGRRHADRTCNDNARDLAKMMSALAATKMQESGSVDLSEVQRPSNMLKTLECDDECRVEARTRQMALALQIRNPDVSAKLAPRYNDTLRATAVREPAFAQQVHDALTDLVQRAKNSKQKTRSHSFPSMNWQKRQFIHELSEHFGCESVAYDAEPNRNVVATADREKSWLPAMSVLEVVARETGKRKVPGPVLRAPPAHAAPARSASAAAANKSSGGGWATLTSTNAWAARSQAKQAAPAQPEPKIDYFDNPPDN